MNASNHPSDPGYLIGRRVVKIGLAIFFAYIIILYKSSSTREFFNTGPVNHLKLHANPAQQMMSTTMNSPRRRLVRIPAEMELPPHISTSTSLQKGVLETFISNSTSVRSSGIINTVAGSLSYGYRGDGEQAIFAGLNKPCGVAVDSSGNIYIADTNNYCIRMVTNSTGIITTVAGNGTLGYSSNYGGLATSASMGSPYGVAVDPVGNIYITDYSYWLVRMVTKSTGMISLEVGKSNKLDYPFGIAVDVTGDNIYIVDGGNNKIRLLIPSLNRIRTVVGYFESGDFNADGLYANITALDDPHGVAVDTSDNMYIADTSNYRIRMVTKSTGRVTTLAGNGTSGYSGDGGLATLAVLNRPYGVAVDTAGNIYIADTYNHCIRMITRSTGIITTVAGDGTPGYWGDGGRATSAKLDHPCGIAVDASGNVYVADTLNNRIRMFVSPAAPLPPSPTRSPVTPRPTVSPNRSVKSSSPAGNAVTASVTAAGLACTVAVFLTW